MAHEHEDMMRNAALNADKEDLLAVLNDRFGEIPEEIKDEIKAISELDAMDKLFLVAVNAANWNVFVTELREGKDTFQMTGDAFNPLAEIQKNPKN